MESRLGESRYCTRTRRRGLGVLVCRCYKKLDVVLEDYSDSDFELFDLWLVNESSGNETCVGLMGWSSLGYNCDNEVTTVLPINDL